MLPNLNSGSIGSDNGLSHVWCQATVLSNGGLLSIGELLKLLTHLPGDIELKSVALGN